MKPYESYSETEYDWILEVPSHWSKTAIRNITKLSDKRNKENDNLELLSVYREYGVIKKSSRDDNHNVESLDLSNYKYVDKGYLVINKMKLWQGSLGVSKHEGIVSPAYIVCRILSNNNLEYLHLLLRSAFFKTYYNRISKGIRVGQWDSNYDDIKKLNVYLPPQSEQDQIVRYLDWQTTKITKLINAKKKQIELLKEQKQAVINKAVTKGLDDTVPMKDSGVEWLGEVPEHWEIRKLKTLGKAIIGLTYSPGNLVESDKGTLVFRSSNIQNGLITYNDNVYVSSYIPDNLITRERDILICSRNGSRDLVGKCALITKEDEGNSFGAFTTVFRTEYAKTIYFILNSVVLKGVMGLFSTSTINQLTTSILNAIVTPFPPLEEQQAIVTYLEEKTALIDKAIAVIEKEIELVSEYKTSLISSVVTGKIDVRDVVVPEFDVVEEVVDDTGNDNVEMEV